MTIIQFKNKVFLENKNKRNYFLIILANFILSLILIIFSNGNQLKMLIILSLINVGIILFGIGWLYLKYQQEISVKEKEAITEKQRENTGRIEQSNNRLRRIQSEQKQIALSEKRDKKKRETQSARILKDINISKETNKRENQKELRDILLGLQMKHINFGMSTTVIGNEQLPGIRKSLISTLRQNGIITFQDINESNLEQISEVGPKKIKSLLNWKKKFREKLIQTQPKKVPYELGNPINEKYKSKNINLEKKEQLEKSQVVIDLEEININAARLLREKKEEEKKEVIFKEPLEKIETDFRDELKPYSEINLPSFVVYAFGWKINKKLRKNLGFFVGIPIIFSVCFQSSFALYANSEVRLANLPTNTPTIAPTVTQTPTIIPSPTFTQTLTVTPSPTFTRTATPTDSPETATIIAEKLTATNISAMISATAESIEITETSISFKITETAVSNNLTATENSYNSTSTAQSYEATATKNAILSTATHEAYWDSITETAVVIEVEATQKAQYSQISRQELVTYPDSHAFELVVFEGRVFNIIGNTELQMYVDWSYDDVYIIFDVPFSGIYEDDWIIIYGMIWGTECGTNAFGGEICFPVIYADLYELK